MSVFDFSHFSGKKSKQGPQINSNLSSVIKQPTESVSFSNNHGSIAIKGIAFNSSYDISKLVIIDDLKVTFTQDIFTSEWSFVNQIEVTIDFYLTESTRYLIKENYEELLNHYPAMEFDESNSLIKIRQNNIRNVDLKKLINELKTAHFSHSNILLPKKMTSDDWQKEKFFQDHNGEIKNKTEEDKDNNSISVSIQKQYSHSTISTYSLNTFYLDFDKEEMPNYEDDPKHKLINSTIYHSKEITSNKQRFTHSVKGNFNSKGAFATVNNCNSKNFIPNITIQQLITNNDLSASQKIDLTCADEYKKMTIKQFIDELCINKGKAIQNHDIQMNDYNNDYHSYDINKNTELICSYIAELELRLSNLNSSMKQGNVQYKNQIENIYIRIKKEISTLKLLKILFLNCFMPLKISNEQYIFHKFHIQNNAVEVKTMRKKKLIEWLIEEKYDSFIKEQNVIKNSNEKIVNSVINGQIKTAIDICYKEKYTYLALLISQLNNQRKTKTLQLNIINWSGIILNQFPEKIRQLYELMSSNDTNKSVIIDSKTDWKNVLIQMALYTLSPDMKIHQLMEELNQLFIKQSLKVPLVFGDENVYDINYILLELFSAIEMSNKDKEDKMLKMLSYSKNIFKINSDHHIQFIISFLLFNNQELYQNINTLKKLHISLLIKTIEELCQNDNSSYWQYAIKLLHLSSIPNLLKKKMIQDIIFNANSQAGNDLREITFYNDSINEKLGCSDLNQFQYKKALEYFKSVNNSNLAVDIYINTILIIDLISSSETERSKAKGKLEEFTNCANWDAYGELFYRYCDINNNRITKEELIYLIQRWIALEKIRSCYSNEYLFSFCKAKIIFELRSRLNALLKQYNDRSQNLMYISIPSREIVIDAKYVEWSSKLSEFYTALHEIKQYKNKTFLLKNEKQN